MKVMTLSTLSTLFALVAACATEAPSPGTSGTKTNTAEVPEIYFSTDPSAPPSVSGQITAGGQAEVDYEPDRMTECEAIGSDGSELPAWGITMYWQIDGGAVNAVEASQDDGDTLVAADPLISIPASAQNLSIWFESTSIYGCVAYDSMYGANYQFSIQ